MNRRSLLGVNCGALLESADRRNAACVAGNNLAGNAFGGEPIVDIDLSASPIGPVVVSAPGAIGANGDLAVEVAFSPTSAMWLQQETSPAICLCEISTAAGSLTLQYEIGRWFLRLGGVAILEVLDPEDGAGGTFRNNLSQTGIAGDYMRVSFGYMPSTGLLFIQVNNNGCTSFLATNRGAPSGTVPVGSHALAPLGAISAIKVGSRVDGTLPIAARWVRFRAIDPTSLSGTTPESVLVVGDSVESALSFSPGSTACAATPSHIYTPAEAMAFDVPRVRNQAIGGATIVSQTATFLANLPLYQSTRGVILAPGINDANADSQTMIADYQTLVNMVRSILQGVKVIARLVTPCRAFLGDTKWALVVALNAALQNGTITGIDYVVTSHFALLSDGNGNLLPSLNPAGDGVHPNDPGRAIIGAAERGGIAAVGLL